MAESAMEHIDNRINDTCPWRGAPKPGQETPVAGVPGFYSIREQYRGSPPDHRALPSCLALCGPHQRLFLVGEGACGQPLIPVTPSSACQCGKPRLSRQETCSWVPCKLRGATDFPGYLKGVRRRVQGPEEHEDLPGPPLAHGPVPEHPNVCTDGSVDPSKQ